MTNEELDRLIDWCRLKMKHTDLTGKYKEGYCEAMLAVMSHLHDEKVHNKKVNKDDQ